MSDNGTRRSTTRSLYARWYDTTKPEDRRRLLPEWRFVKVLDRLVPLLATERRKRRALQERIEALEQRIATLEHAAVTRETPPLTRELQPLAAAGRRPAWEVIARQAR
jgi:hypothetical protein